LVGFGFGGTVVAVGGTGVSVAGGGGTGVLVAGTGVSVGMVVGVSVGEGVGSVVLVGGTAVAVGGIRVAVGGTAIASMGVDDGSTTVRVGVLAEAADAVRLSVPTCLGPEDLPATTRISSTPARTKCSAPIPVSSISLRLSGLSVGDGDVSVGIWDMGLCVTKGETERIPCSPETREVGGNRPGDAMCSLPNLSHGHTAIIAN
jgi:hypothetical protein